MKPREQGDAGELSALSWFVENGWKVFLPFGHSPDVDMVARRDGLTIGVQVKTCAEQRKGRYEVRLCTMGGNQSWTGVVKRFSADRCDHLFAVAGSGRRWFIPSSVVGGERGIMLGGPKYAQYEVEQGPPLSVLAGHGPLIAATI